MKKLSNTQAMYILRTVLALQLFVLGFILGLMFSSKTECNHVADSASEYTFVIDSMEAPTASVVESVSLYDLTGETTLYSAITSLGLPYKATVDMLAHDMFIDNGSIENNEKILRTPLSKSMLAKIKGNKNNHASTPVSEHRVSKVTAVVSPIVKTEAISSDVTSNVSTVVANTVETADGDINKAERMWIDSVNKVISKQINDKRNQEAAENRDWTGVHMPAFDKFEKTEHTFKDSYAVTMSSKPEKVQKRETKHLKKLKRKANRRKTLLAIDNFICKVLPFYACKTTKNPTYN